MTHRFTKALPAAGVALCLGLGLVACTDGGNHGGAKSAGAPSASARASSSAAYQPATDKHPARNVPKPKMTDAARKETFEGAQAFMKYFQDCENYMTQTGDSQCMKDSVVSTDKAHLEAARLIREAYNDGDWVTGGHVTYHAEISYRFTKIDDFYSLLVYQRVQPGVQLGKDGKKKGEIHSFNSTNQPQELWMKFMGGAWKIIHILNIQGVKYER